MAWPSPPASRALPNPMSCVTLTMLLLLSSLVSTGMRTILFQSGFSRALFQDIAAGNDVVGHNFDLVVIGGGGRVDPRAGDHLRVLFLTGQKLLVRSLIDSGGGERQPGQHHARQKRRQQFLFHISYLPAYCLLWFSVVRVCLFLIYFCRNGRNRTGNSAGNNSCSYCPPLHG